MQTLTAAEVAAATRCPAPAVSANWPLLQAAMAEFGIDRPLVAVGLAATIAVETAHRFVPLSEFGDHPEYDTGRIAARLGNTPEADGDGQRYEGRGLIQTTGLRNYTATGKALGLDLVTHPELLLDPQHAARAAAWFFREHLAAVASDAQDWRRVRRIVNGGYNGWDAFNWAVVRLLRRAEGIAA